MKRIKPLIMMLGTLFLTVSCGPTTEDSDSQSITFFGWGSAEEQSNFQTLVDEFMVENPTIKVAYSAVSSDSYMTALNGRGRNLPDVFYVPDYEFMQWADSGKCLAIDDYIDAEEINKLWPLSTSMYRYDRGTYTLGEGKLYGLPKDLGPYAIVYNKTLLQSIIEEKNLNIGLPDKEIPMTWAEFTDYLKAITGRATVNNSQKDVFGIGYYELMAAVYSNNADFFDSEVKNQRITDKNFIDAVQWISDLSNVHHVAPSADQQSSQNSFQRFLNQGCVFTFMGPWDCKQFWNDLTFDFDIIPTPVGPAEGAKSTSWVGSVAFAVNANSKKKEAAVKLAKFLACSETANVMNYKLGQAIPNMIEFAENQYIQGEGLEGRQLMPENRKLFVDIVRGNEYIAGKNRARYYLYDNTAYDDLEYNLSAVFTGSQTAEAFLTSYAEKYQKQLDNSNAFLN